jgi:cytochrome c-type protein NapB
MKLINTISLCMLGTATLFFSGCNDAATPKQEVAKPTISEESLGLRKVDLYSEDTVMPDETKYGKDAATTSKTISRAFQDAPPMIPHDVEGMLPITINNNQCVGCHAPGVAQSMNALPYPASHMTNFRPQTAIAKDGRIAKNGKAVDNTSSDKLSHVSIKNLGKLSGARFNCSQCHAPQSQMEAPANTFEPDFITKDGAKKSAWKGSSLTDGLNTLMD